MIYFHRYLHFHHFENNQGRNVYYLADISSIYHIKLAHNIYNGDVEQIMKKVRYTFDMICVGYLHSSFYGQLVAFENFDLNFF